MATVTGIWIPDYDGALATGLVGTMATGTSTGAIVLGKHRLFKISVTRSTTPSNANERFAIRFTMGNSTAGHAAITPTSTSPFITTDQDWTMDTGDAYDSINLANLVGDNTAITISYAILPLSKF